MTYNSEGISALVKVVDDIQNTKLNFIDKKIKSLLKCLAYYDEFKAVLQYVYKGFNYENEMRKAQIRIGERYAFHLPKNDTALVALVSGLLVEADEGNLDIITFVATYFPASTNQESFNLFFDSVLEPFKLALVRLVINGIQEEVVFVEPSVELAPTGLTEQMHSLLSKFVKDVNEAQISDDARSNLRMQLEGFAIALDNRDAKIIRAIWIGLKATLTATKLSAKEIEKAEELLKLYLVTK
ncbi:MAG: hypothetical protein MJ193_04830 [Clostridia bacterium]|nr:hypothetical protein [Clostridia bacterium]